MVSSLEYAVYLLLQTRCLLSAYYHFLAAIRLDLPFLAAGIPVLARARSTPHPPRNFLRIAVSQSMGKGSEGGAGRRPEAGIKPECCCGDRIFP